MKFVCLALAFLACTITVSALFDDFVDIYDYVIIGGGGAGLIMANRLSEDPTKTVLVLNRGADDVCDTCDNSSGSNGPQEGSILNNGLYSKNGANYFTTPNLFPGRSIREVRTNLPGGNTRLYGGTSIPSAKALINKFWPADVNYDVMRPYFNKWQDHFCNYFSPAVTGINATDCAFYHGSKGGPMSVSPLVPGPDTDIAKDLLASGPQVGVRVVPDPFNPNYQTGSYMYAQHTLANRANPNDINSARTRESTYTGYLPRTLRASRDNLDFAFGAEGRELIFGSDLAQFPGIARILGLPRNVSPKRAIGVKYFVPGDEIRVVFARKHIVLCGGVEGSIKFLQHNGIGPADLLAKVGIPLVANNPYVGQQITAHAAVAMSFRTKNPILTNPSNSGKSVIMQLSSPTNNGFADIEIEVYLGGVVASFDFALTGTDPTYFTDFGANGGYPYISAFVEIVDPVNRGSINITGPRYEEPSQVEYGWSKGFDYAQSADYQKTMYGFNKLREIFTGNNTFSNKHIVREYLPGLAPTPTEQFNKDLFFSAYNQHSIYHTNGGVALGKATNSAGLLKGIEGLSVCDNSVLPYSPNGNPSSTMFALCEYIADKVKAY